MYQCKLSDKRLCDRPTGPPIGFLSGPDQIEGTVQYFDVHFSTSDTTTNPTGTKDFLTLKYEHRQAERRWIEEKDHLLRELDKLKEVKIYKDSYTNYQLFNGIDQ